MMRYHSLNRQERVPRYLVVIVHHFNCAECTSVIVMEWALHIARADLCHNVALVSTASRLYFLLSLCHERPLAVSAHAGKASCSEFTSKFVNFFFVICNSFNSW